MQVLFDTYVNGLKCQFTKGMWSKDPDMTNVLFDT